MEPAAQLKQGTACYHCGETCRDTQLRLEEKYFCCSGCKMVYEILNDHELCRYYDLNKNPGSAQQVNVRADKFAFLDDAAIAAKLISFSDTRQTQVSFYLPQIHCSSCLWLLEHIHKINPGIISSRVNFMEKEVFLVFEQDKASLRSVVETLTAVGYEPHISLQEATQNTPPKAGKKRLYQLGIAGFCFVNIMMMSFPEYFSIGGYLEKEIGNALHYFIVALSLPVIFYCASEFFIAAWKGLVNKVLNIDLPIALAIAITFLRSLYELGTGTGTGYLDSMSGIIFFMLLGRLVQDKTYRFLSFDRDFRSFFPIAVNVLQDGHFRPREVAELRVNDVIQIHVNELIPVDCILSKGIAEIDYSFVNGEMIPVRKEIGELIYAGGKQLGTNLELLVVKEVSQSYLTNLWNKDVFKQEKKSVSVIHALSKYFTAVVLLIGAAAALYWAFRGQPQLMWNALTTILIVACPCALLLSATFTNGNILRILSKHKLYLRHPDVIEDLAKTEHIVFDKTGTITQARKMKVAYRGTTLSKVQKQRIATLLAQSAHPLSRIIYQHLDLPGHERIDSFREISGQGIEGWIDETHIKLGSASFVQSQPSTETGSVVYVRIEQDVPGAFHIRNSYRSGFKEMILRLKQHYSLSVLSGDNNSEAPYLKDIMGSDTELCFERQPHEKLEYIQQLQERLLNVLMIGDGLNDAGALKQSNVGIALTEGNNNFTPSSDGILDASRFRDLHRFIAFARSGQRIIRASFVLSVAYNIIGLYFAVQGNLSPLVAAILMPASSLSIILVTYGLSEWAGRKLDRRVPGQ